MSTMPELDYKLENNKVLVSLTLKVPIKFEIEMQAIGNKGYSTVEDLANIEGEIIENAVNTGANLLMNEINNFKINEQIEALSSQLVTHTSTDNHNQFGSDIYDVQLPLNNSNNQIEYYNQEYLIKKKRKVRFADSLNDGLTLMVNCVGGMLFMGKLANYSWE